MKRGASEWPADAAALVDPADREGPADLAEDCPATQPRLRSGCLPA